MVPSFEISESGIRKVRFPLLHKVNTHKDFFNVIITSLKADNKKMLVTTT